MEKILITDHRSPLLEEVKASTSECGSGPEIIFHDTACEARKCFREESIDEAWLISCKDMSVFNLAGAIVKDDPKASVFVVDDGAKGEMRPETSFDSWEIATEEGFRSRLLDRLAFSVQPIEQKNDGVSDVESEINLEEDAFDEDVFDMGVSDHFSIDRESKNEARSKRGAFVISVMSGSGGVGKSSIVATAAYLAASKGFSVSVLDCDFQFGDMFQLMGKVPCTSVDDILLDESLFQAFAKSCNRDVPALICAPARLESSEELSNHLEEILDGCASLFDVVFVNTGSSWSEINAQLIEKSSCNLFIVDQRASSVRSCQHALELCMRLGLATGQFMYALNRCDRRSLLCATDVSNAMRGANVIELKEGGQEVEELLGMGLAGELAASKNAFTDSLNDLLIEVLP